MKGITERFTRRNPTGLRWLLLSILAAGLVAGAVVWALSNYQEYSQTLDLFLN